MNLVDILKQYSSPTTTPSGDIFGHFESVAQQAPTASLGSGIAAALRSNATPSFGQTVTNLFSQSNPEQKAGVLNEMMQVIGAAGLAKMGGTLGRILGSSPSGPITPTQAAQVPPPDVTAVAASAQQHDDSIVDRIGSFYAQHPTVVKTLGVVALGMVMSHMSQQQRT